MLPNLRQALELVDLGYMVFALSDTGKPYPNCQECRRHHDEPNDYEQCSCLFCHGCYAGTNLFKDLEAMWQEQPDSLVGIRTGKASNIFVLDFDVHDNGKDGIATLTEMTQIDNLLLPTTTVLTSGGGIHLYYRYPHTQKVQNDNRGGVGPGVDVKGDGGFVIAPPSQKRDRVSYKWYPGCSPQRVTPVAASPALLALLPQPKQADHYVYTTQSFEVDLSTMVSYDFQRALDQLEFAPNGSRNSYLYTAACRGGEAIAAGAMHWDKVRVLLAQYGSAAGLTRSEIRGTVRGGLARGMREYKPSV